MDSGRCKADGVQCLFSRDPKGSEFGRGIVIPPDLNRIIVDYIKTIFTRRLEWLYVLE